ncbi:MAG: PhnD/SsuA/transferrin family substrate-binding protein [Defluviicoccus sp.]|nr:PhnD/SsuA/transferrin family substrate-binding protein [Defluviicoccus sp.]MDE0382306.1 PhnD/SsuA/transferrin family substrate-binding protein [Defluviicoccus sp.]
MTLIANSRMYNATPRVKAGWDRIFAFVGERSETALEIVDHAAPAPLETLWRRPDIGCVFMCGWPFAMADTKPRIVCAPVPRPPRYGGMPVYVTDFVVRADSTATTLEDTFGGRLAWTVDHSHSGYNAARHHLLRWRTDARPRLFAESVGPLFAPRAVIAAILDGRADVGPVDGWYLDLLRHNDPSAVADLRVVATTAAAPAPPLVAHAGMAEAELERLRSAFLDIPRQRSLEPVLETILIREFVVPEARAYDSTLAWAREAAQAGVGAMTDL